MQSRNGKSAKAEVVQSSRSMSAKAKIDDPCYSRETPGRKKESKPLKKAASAPVVPKVVDRYVFLQRSFFALLAYIQVFRGCTYQSIPFATFPAQCQCRPGRPAPTTYKGRKKPVSRGDCYKNTAVCETGQAAEEHDIEQKKKSRAFQDR